MKDIKAIETREFQFEHLIAGCKVFSVEVKNNQEQQHRRKVNCGVTLG